MNWVQLAIPLIALAVWILASIIGNAQQQQRAPRRNLPKPPQQGPDIPRGAEGEAPQPTEEQERRLEEAKSRRRTAAQKQSGLEHQRQQERDQARRRATSEEPLRLPPPLPEKPRRTERQPERPPERPPERRPASRPSERREERKEERREDFIPVAKPIAKPATQREAAREVPGRESAASMTARRDRPRNQSYQATSLTDEMPSMGLLTEALEAAATVQRDAPSPVALEVARLLQNPRSLAAAFVLREVFDPPKAMRNRKAPLARRASE